MAILIDVSDVAHCCLLPDPLGPPLRVVDGTGCCFAVRFRDSCRQSHSPSFCRTELPHDTRRRVIFILKYIILLLIITILGRTSIFMSRYNLIPAKRKKGVRPRETLLGPLLAKKLARSFSEQQRHLTGQARSSSVKANAIRRDQP